MQAPNYRGGRRQENHFVGDVLAAGDSKMASPPRWGEIPSSRVGDLEAALSKLVVRDRKTGRWPMSVWMLRSFRELGFPVETRVLELKDPVLSYLGHAFDEAKGRESRNFYTFLHEAANAKVAGFDVSGVVSPERLGDSDLRSYLSSLSAKRQPGGFVKIMAGLTELGLGVDDVGFDPLVRVRDPGARPHWLGMFERSCHLDEAADFSKSHPPLQGYVWMAEPLRTLGFTDASQGLDVVSHVRETDLKLRGRGSSLVGEVLDHYAAPECKNRDRWWFYSLRAAELANLGVLTHARKN